jgi:Protein of unknown function (DUF2911)
MKSNYLLLGCLAVASYMTVDAEGHGQAVGSHAQAVDKGMVVYTLGLDTITVQYFEYDNRRFRTTILDLDGTIGKYEATGVLDENGNISEVQSKIYRIDSAGNWVLSGEGFNKVIGDSTVYTLMRQGTQVRRRAVAGKAIVSNAGDQTSFFMFPYMGFFASPRLNDTLYHCQFAFGECRPYHVTRVSEHELHVGSGVMGGIKLFTGEDGRLDSANAIGSSLNFIAGVNRGGNDYVGYLDRLAKVKFATHSAAKPTTKDSARLVVGGKKMAIDYWSPMTRGRQIFGAVVPWNRIWRTGANNATKLTTEVALQHEGNLTADVSTLPAGEYSLWTYPTEKGWWLIINKKAFVWGTEYDSMADVMKWPMQVEQTAEKVEALKIALLDMGGGVVRIQVTWDRYKAWVDCKAK